MPSERGLDRIVAFADAVVAIASTLLVLPLVDLATQDAGVPLDRLLHGHLAQFGAFALSFAVIARLWVAHHRLFERLGTYDAMIVWLTLVWLSTVAFLPFPTAILATESGHAASVLYVGTLLVSSLAFASTAAWVSAHPALRRTAEPGAVVDDPHGTTAVLLAVAFLLTVFVPHANVWPLLILLFSGPVDAVRRRRSRRCASPSLSVAEKKG